jgi:hypothetical protein
MEKVALQFLNQAYFLNQSFCFAYSEVLPNNYLRQYQKRYRSAQNRNQ